jgi:hypothetical protein
MYDSSWSWNHKKLLGPKSISIHTIQFSDTAAMPPPKIATQKVKMWREKTHVTPPKGDLMTD